LGELAERLEVFIREWNEKGHRFKWTRENEAKLIARFEQKMMREVSTDESGRAKGKGQTLERQKITTFSQ
jgi:hypothetical protein